MVLPVLAGPFEDAVGNSPTMISDTEDAVGVIATSGNPLAFPIISALQDGRLMADPDTKKIYVTQPDGKSIDALTGAPVASVPDSAAAVRLNNHLRRAVEAAIGGLTLSSPDADKRIEAAQSVFKTHDEAMLPLIDGACKRDQQGRQAGLCRGARRDPAVQGRRHRSRSSTPSRPSARAATRKRWRC